MHRLPSRTLDLGLALALALLGGCAVGPDFKTPEPPRAQKYAPTDLPLQTHAAPAAEAPAQQFVPGAPVDAQWWTALHNPKLDAFIQSALRASPNVEAAHAALRAAQENVSAQRGFYYPNVQASYSATRQKPPGGAPPGIYTLHTAQLNIGFTPDVFGGNSRQVESLQAQAEVQEFQWRAAAVTLESNIAAAAIQDALLREQMGIVQQMIDAGTSSVELAQKQWKAGYLSRLDVALQESALAQNRQLLPPLQRQFEQNRNLLRALAGAMPDEEVPAFALSEFQLPAQLPVSLPSQLVGQRPDVLAAQAQLHAATAQVGVARAARLPQITLNGSVGGAAAQLAQLSSGGFFSIGAAVAQPIFEGGTLLHRERSARESLTQAEALYRVAVIAALQNVADTLHAIYTDADALEAAAQQATSARVALDLTKKQYGHGYLDRVALITAEQTDRQAQLTLAQSTANRLTDSVALYQALGGGWNQDHPDTQASAQQKDPHGEAQQAHDAQPH